MQYDNGDNEGCLESICSCCKYGCCKMITFTINAWIKRYLRMIPMILYVMLMTAYLLDQLPTGYHVVDRTIYNECCSNTFWQNILLIKNFTMGFTYEDTECLFGCMNHIWYLCCDFQLFLILPMLVWIYTRYNNKWKMTSMIITFIICLGGVGIRFSWDFIMNLVQIYYLEHQKQ